MVKLVEVCQANRYTSSGNFKEYSLREVYVNPEHVVCIREESRSAGVIKESLKDLDPRTRFTKVHVAGGQHGLDILVIGEPTSIGEKLGIVGKARTLLKG
tara:strand:- start:134 stop:433 length:300 start_codon:yes stop_codon:yes gene_type:complete